MSSEIYKEEPRMSEYGCLPRPPLLPIAPVVSLKKPKIALTKRKMYSLKFN